MKLILIYGPPASGKLTIAKQLEKKTKFKVFHNHSIIDLLTSVLNPNSRSFWNFSKKIRLDIIKEAAKEKVKGMIITIAYTGKEDDFIKRALRTAKDSYLIKLECDLKELRKRVSRKSRKYHGKIADRKGLDRWLKKYDAKSVYPHKKSLVLDTSKLSIKQCVSRILKYC
ncbi:AAA family ATPase [Candidatus Woesearchaeota archaeon]|nr:AAA family ATPase [Candidatus Woesearchaeota archaeon]